MALEITRDLQILVRAPDAVSQEKITTFVDSHRNWLEKHIARMHAKIAAHPEPSPEQAEIYRKKAKDYIPSRVAYYSKKMNLLPTGIAITGAKTRFGSCSGKNRLSFSWRLMEYPLEAVDYVVVHELAHIMHKNHGFDFYRLIATYLPDWKQRKQLLK
jgi:predicted metal-dependent hydrolase